MSQTIRVADYIARFIAGQGVKQIFLLPGGGAMHLNDGIASEKRLTAIPCHHEQSCGIAAEAWGRVAGSFGVAMVTTGPGATNVITPVAGAWIESVPMLVISGQVKRADRINGRPLRQGGVQEAEIIPMVKGVTKYAVTVEDPSQIRYHLERALHEMLTGRQGPVWLDIPLDIQAAPITPDSLIGFNSEDSTENTVESAVINRVIELIENAERPLLLAGHGVRLAGAAKEFSRLVEILQLPVVTTWNALDLIPYDHPLCVGRPGVVALRAPNLAVQNCDLLISIGSRLDNIITAYNPRGFARAAKKVVVDVDQNEIDKLDMEIELGIACDAKLFISTLLNHVTPKTASDFRRSWLDRCTAWKQRYPVNDGQPFDTTGKISHYHFVNALSDVAPPETLISTGSSGLAIEVFYTVFRNKAGQRVFLTSGLGSMGYGLPAAIGACIANGSRPMLAIESDGSLQLNLQELATIKGGNLPICLMVMNNAGYCSIRNTQRNYFDGRYLGTGPEAGLWLPDLEKLAMAYELPFMKIDEASSIDRKLQEAIELPRPCIIDIRLATDEILMPKASAIPQSDGSIISMPLEDMTPLLPLNQLKEEMIIDLHPASLAAKR